MWNEYISLYRQELCSDSEEETKKKRCDMTLKLISIYEDIEKNQIVAVDVDNYLFWTLLVDETQAKTILDRAINLYPDSSILWLKSIEYNYDSSEKEMRFLKALETVQETEIWFVRKAYIDWLKTQESESFHEKIKLEFQRASLDVIHGSEAMSAYLHWEYERMGPSAALELCLNFFKDRITIQVLKELMNLQKMTTASSNGQEEIRELFEMMLRTKDAASHHQLWLDYISWELRRDQFETAQHLYWRALKLVSNPETFTSHYQALL